MHAKIDIALDISPLPHIMYCQAKIIVVHVKEDLVASVYLIKV
jgi:hypothetical protein